jgi:hypothetical protein
LKKDEQKDKNNIRVYGAFVMIWKSAQGKVNRKTLTLAKMRTIIVREAMNTLVDQLVPPT